MDNLIKNSLIFNFFNNIYTFIYSKLDFYIQTSLILKYIKQISLFCVCLLLFLSPFVSTSLNAILVLLCTFTTILYILKRTENKVTNYKLYIPVVIFFSIAIIATGFSPYFVPALKGLAKMLIFLLAFFVFINNIEKENIKWILVSLLLASTIVSIYGIWQFYIKVPPLALWDDSESLSKLTRVYSTLKNPNLLAGYLLIPISLSLGVILTLKSNFKLLGLVIFGINLTCLYFTYSRGGWLGGIAVILTFLVISIYVYREKIAKIPYLKIGILIIILLCISVILFLFFKSEAFRERIMSFVSFRTHSSNSFRLNVWTAVINMIKDFYLTGIGPGNTVFNKVYPFYMITKYEALSAYNIFLEVFVELGILGIISFLWLLFTYIKQTWKNIVYSDSFVKILNISCLCAIVGILTHGLVDTVFYRPQVQILFWLILAIVVKTSSSRDDVNITVLHK